MSILFDSLDVIGRRFHQRLNDTEASVPIRVIGVVRDATYAATCESRVHPLVFEAPDRHDSRKASSYPP